MTTGNRESFDIVVLGGGPAGYVAAIRAAQLGARVAVVERDRVGGTCLNRGCIPSKAFIESVHVFRQVKEAARFGVDVGEPTPNWARVLDRKRQIVNQLVGGVEGLLKGHRIELVTGSGRLRAPGRIEVRLPNGERRNLSSRYTVIATGSEPARIPVPGATLSGVITSDELLEVPAIPNRLVIVGGGVIGVEFAGVFAGLGSRVTIVEMLPMILAGVDDEVARRFLALLKRQGVEVHLNARVKEVQEVERGRRVVFETGEDERQAEGDLVLMATGRRAVTEGIGLDEAGVLLSGRFVGANERMETNVPGVYAAGDVVGGWMLAHKAFREGEVAVENALGRRSKVDYRAVPNCIYSYPEIAGVGLTEKQARESGANVSVAKYPFAANGRALTLGETDGFVKIVADADTGEVLGVHILGPEATELIAEATLAIQIEATVEDLAATIHAHPSLAEAVHESALGHLEGSIHYMARRT
ncbi:MAG: dihydrolipoyl dehydrogenase [Chloroflexi bacterium]|nr:dihydrolipoyl dehydrogenase [Chloroflexota bacterium]